MTELPPELRKGLKPIRAFDLVGFHPVQTEYDEKGNLYLKEDVEKAFASFLETAQKKLKEKASKHWTCKDGMHGNKQCLNIIEENIDAVFGEEKK